MKHPEPHPAPRSDDHPALDAELVEALLQAQAAAPAAPAPAAAAARIKHRLFERIADQETRLLTVQAVDDHWQPFQHGVAIKVLHEADGLMSYLLRLAPGAVLPAHRHPVDEHCIVLEGSLRIGAELVVPAGGFHLAPRGALHSAITSDGGATIFLRGAAPEIELMI